MTMMAWAAVCGLTQLGQASGPAANLPEPISLLLIGLGALLLEIKRRRLSRGR
jgi:hypothetical protein